jgi:hypothetical protein
VYHLLGIDELIETNAKGCCRGTTFAELRRTIAREPALPRLAPPQARLDSSQKVRARRADGEGDEHAGAFSPGRAAPQPQGSFLPAAPVRVEMD